MIDSTSDAIVVGAGPNGLAAAITMPHPGRGGRTRRRADRWRWARSAELTLPGFIHDVCSAIHPLAVASPFLRELPLAEQLEPVQPDAPLAHPLEGRAVVLSRSLESLTRSDLPGRRG